MATSEPIKRPSLKIRIDYDQDNRIGPGKIELLEAIESCGSISEAARNRSMSYHYAWNLVDEMNRTFGREVVTGRSGGENGGGAKLTSFGIELVERYRNIERAVEAAVRIDLLALQAELEWPGHGRKTRRA
jgi:molybdate transport system regulatory protein